ncbi:hypothetical protein MNBD_ALPHA01-69 [hydrothermal vent metagenome]|uniref:EF-hand domain-containing protein n=1 Tax=hydrothermal vent metagenome TaxID=652676 RepID=A0A3B0SM91_9ZZZZ
MKKILFVTVASIAAMSFTSLAYAGDKMHKMHKMKMKGAHMMHEMMDADKDGSVSAEEFQAFRSQKFADADKNNDGNLDAGEYEALAKVMAEQRKKAMEMAKKKKAKKHFDKMDADGDGKISKAEFDAKGERGFTRMDKNDDGMLNMDDRSYGKDKMKKAKDKMKKMDHQH